MKLKFNRIYNNLGINKRAVFFLAAGIAIIIAARLYAKRHFILSSEKQYVKFAVACKDLKRYSVRGSPTYDELITRAQHFNEYYTTEAKKILDTISFPKSEYFIQSDERFAHIKFSQYMDQFKNTISERLPGVNVHGKFLETDPIRSTVTELNKQLKRMWFLKVFIERMQGCGYDSSHFANIAIGDSGISVSLHDLAVFAYGDIAMIEVRFKLTVDELLKVFRIFRNPNGYFFVEDIQIQAPEGYQLTQDGKLDIRCKLLCLELTLKDSPAYSPITPSWRLNSDG